MIDTIKRILFLVCITTLCLTDATASVKRGVSMHIPTILTEGGESFSRAKASIYIGASTKEKTICLGGDVSFEVKITGTDRYSIVWKRKQLNAAEEVLQEKGESVFSKSNLSHADSGSYYCQLVDSTQVDNPIVFYSDTLTLSIHELSVLIKEPTSLNVCSGDTINLQAVVTSIPSAAADQSFSWSANNIVGNTTEKEVKVVLDTDAQVRIAVQDAYCTTKDTINFTIEPFDVQIQKENVDLNICTQDSIVLRAIGTTPALYSWSGAGIIGDGKADTVKVKFADNGEFVLNSTSENGRCKATDTIRFGVQKFTIDIETPTQDHNICLNSALQLSAVWTGDDNFGVPTYLWEGLGIESEPRLNKIDILVKESAKYRLTSSLGACIAKDSVTYTVYQLKVGIEDLSPSALNICNGDTVCLKSTFGTSSPTSDTTFFWKAEHILENSLDSVKAVLETNNLVRLIVETAYCKDSADVQFNLSYFDIDIESDYSDANVCDGAEIQLSAVVVQPTPQGTNHICRWEGVGIAGEFDGPKVVNVKFDKNGEFILNSTDFEQKCTATDTIRFVVEQFSGKIAVPVGELKACVGDTIRLKSEVKSNIGGKINYNWSGEKIFGESVLDSVKIIATTQGKYKLETSLSKCSDIDSIEYQVIDFNVEISTPTQHKICYGDTVVLRVANPAVGTDTSYVWSTENEIIGAANLDSVKIVLKEHARVSVRSRTSACVADDSYDFTIVSYNLDIKSSLQDTEACLGSVLILEASNAATAPLHSTWKWSGNGVQTESGTSTEVKISDNGKFYLEYSDGQCVEKDSISYIVRKYDVKINIPQEGLTPCWLDTLILTVSNKGNTPDGGRYTWSGAGIYGEKNADTVKLKVFDNGQFILEAFDGKCTTKDTINLEIHKYDIGIAQPAQWPNICKGANIVLQATNSGAEPIGATYEWGGNTILGDAKSSQVDAVVDAIGEYTLKASDGQCDIYDTIQYKVQTYDIQIEQPTSVDVCQGTELTLNVTNKDGESYSWSGDGIIGATNQVSVHIALTENNRFILTTAKGVCTIKDTMDFNIKKYRLVLPKSLVLPEAQTITLTAEKETQSTLDWYVNGSHAFGPSANNTANLEIAMSSQVKVIMTMNEDKCTTTAVCNVRVGQRDSRKYRGGIADGYGHEQPSLNLFKTDTSVCEYTPVYARLQPVLYDGYNYKWFKVDETNSNPEPICIGMEFYIPRCLVSDAGEYYCRVEDVVNGGYIYSDTLTLVVQRGPQSQIQPPVGGGNYCYGEVFNLSPVFTDAAYRYEWRGANIISGAMEPQVSIRAVNNDLYTLEVSDGNCSSVDSIRIEVAKLLEIDITNNINIAEPKEVQLAAWTNVANGNVAWTWKTGSATGKEITLSVTEELVVYAELTDGFCSTKDSCHILIKDAITFWGGENDGFSESVAGIRVKEDKLFACTGESVTMEIVGTTASNSTYEWFKIENTIDKTIGRSYTIPVCSKTDAGSYYCRATSGDVEWYSDTLTLTIEEGPIANITTSNLKACAGEEKRLEANPIVGTYNWIGHNIISGVNESSMIVKAERTATYILEVSEGHCSTTDTVLLEVTNPMIDITDFAYMAEIGDVKLGAERSDLNSIVYWFIDGEIARQSKDSVILSISKTGQTIITASIEESGCTVVDSMIVSVKNLGTFTAGATGDDGFGLAVPKLRVEKVSISACPTSDVVLRLREGISEYYGYQWYKVDPPKDIALSSGLSHEILNIGTGDQGEYYCKAFSIDGTIHSSDRVTLNILPGVVADLTIKNDDRKLCFGEDVLFTAQVSPPGEYTYQWRGPGVSNGEIGAQLAMKALEDGQYSVRVSDGNCSSSDTMSIQVTRLFVDMVATKNLSEAGLVNFVASTTEPEISWYIGHQFQAGKNTSTVDLEIAKNELVKAVVSFNNCTDTAFTEVFIKDATTFTAGASDNDGFGDSKPNLVVEEEGLKEACQGSTVVLSVRDAGYENYNYVWYKNGELMDPAVIGREYVIHDVKKAEHDGIYTCKVKNPDTDELMVSASISLSIHDNPAVTLQPLATAVCYNTEAILTSEIDRLDGAIYEWSGADIVGNNNESTVKIKPLQSGIYTVKVSHETTSCSDTASVWVDVNHMDIDLPEHLFLAAPQMYNFNVEQKLGETAIWYIKPSGSETFIAQESEILNITENCVVKLEVKKEHCTEFAACSVFIKNFELFAGGTDDGFGLGNSRVFVEIHPKDSAICTGNSLTLTARVIGDGFYDYKWYKEKRAGVIHEEKEFTINNMNSNMAGGYYCIVTNLSLDLADKNRVMKSDTAQVLYKDGPKASIESPENGADICNGVEVTLTAAKIDNAEITYEWIGDGLVDAVSQSNTITFIPKGESYILRVADPIGGCSSTDTVHLQMNNPQILLPEQLHLNEAKQISVQAEKPAGTTVNWKLYVDGAISSELSNSDIGHFRIAKTSMLVAEVVKLVVDGTCSGYDTTMVYVKYPSTFTSGKGDEDGFSSTLPKVTLKILPGDTEFCRGTPLFRELSSNISEKIMRYEWRKVGASNIVCYGEKLMIPICERIDSGSYYCMAIDLAAIQGEQKVYHSDTVDLRVLAGPLAKISSPTDGLAVCYREVIDLDASRTEIDKEPSTDVYEYTWTGENIKAPTLFKTQASPEGNGVYMLKASNGICTTYDTVTVHLSIPDLQIQRSLFIDKNGVNQFVVDNPKNNGLNWYVDNDIKVEHENKDTANIFIKGDSKVIVEMNEEGCIKTDTCFVFKKTGGTFLVAGGELANDDGFFASGSGFYINEIISTRLVCEGATSVFNIEVVGNDFYSYAWKKRSGTGVLSTDQTYRIDTTELYDAGEYYCEVTDRSSNKVLESKFVSLEVIKNPDTRIVLANKDVCEREPITMAANKEFLDDTRSYTYLWTGADIENNKESSITLTPRHSGRYTLIISDENCFSQDEVDVTVIKQSLQVQKVYLAKAGEDISIQASVLEGVKVNWLVNNVMYRNVNPLLLREIKESVTYIAETEGACVEREKGHVFVKNNTGYAGGEDDGFVTPNAMPQIIENSPEIVGCGKDTASLFVKVLKEDDVQEYIWQKYESVNFVTIDPAKYPKIQGLGTKKIFFPEITIEYAGRYRCRVRSEQGYTNGPATNLVKGDVPEIVGPMNDIQSCAGKDINFIVSTHIPNEGVDPGYRWFYSKTNGNFGQLLPELDLDEPFYKILAIEKADQGYYMVEAHNLCGSVTDTAYLDVWEKPRIVAQSSDTTICAESRVRFWVKAEGGGTYGYALFHIEEDAQGNYIKDKRMVYIGSNPYCDILVPTEIDEGAYVWEVSNDCDLTRHTKSFHLKIERSLDVTYSYIDTTICIGTHTLLLDATANIADAGETTRYSWTKDNLKIDQNTAIHRLRNLVHADTGVYKCYANNACPSQLMKEFRVHKREAPMIEANISLAKKSYCEGQFVEITVNYTSDAGLVTPQWYFAALGASGIPLQNEEGRISGVNSDTLQIDSVVDRDNGRYYVILTNDCGNRQSNSVNLVVDMPARFAVGGSLEGKDKYLCEGDNTVLSVIATGIEPIQYSWRKDGQIIAGAKTARLALNDISRQDTGNYCCNIQNQCNIQSENTCTSLNIITPILFKLLGAGNYCGYEDGREVKLSGFESNVVYQLYRYNSDGTATVVATMNGADFAVDQELSFGFMSFGKYYAVATRYLGEKICTAEMTGTIEIIQDITPAQYEFAVSDPICTGETSGSLTLFGSENDKTIEYTLQRFTEPDIWKNYGHALTGNGAELIWNNLAAGIYRVQAISTLSGCKLQIGESDTLAERPYPQEFELMARDRDTTNCAGMAADVALEVVGIESNTQYTLIKDGLETDRTLSGESIVWDKVEGILNGTEYAVKATTSYGCSIERGEVIVVEKEAPISFFVRGSGFYCSGDTLSREIIIEGKTQIGVRYEVYKSNDEPVLVDTIFYGTGSVIEFSLPSEANNYYITAVDTLDGCISSMQNEISIKEDSLKIMPIADQIIYTGTQAYLAADIRNAEGSLDIVWQAEDLFETGGNKTNPATTKHLNSGAIFILTVGDGHCTVDAQARVRLDGASLYTQIKLNCVTDADTLSICEGETIDLCAWTDGGESPYTYKWIDKDVSLTTAIGTESQIIGYPKTESGYIYFEVKTAVGQRAQDSIYIDINPIPQNNLVVLNSGLNCSLIEDTVRFVLQNSENGIKYTLEYSQSGKGYVAQSDIQIGNQEDLTFKIEYTHERAGYYRLLAEKKNKKTSCSSHISLGELRQKPQVYDVSLLGDAVYCEYSKKDSIRLSQSELGVSYRLINTATDVVMKVEEGSGNSILYADYFGTGRYRVVAQLGVCTDSMAHVVNINAIERPLIGKVTGLGAYCLTSENIPVKIEIPITFRGAKYTLYRDSVELWEEVDVKYSNGEIIKFNMPEKAGNYVIISSLQNGEDESLCCTDTVRGLALLPAPSKIKLKEGRTIYCADEEGVDVVISIYDIELVQQYVLKNLRGEVVGTFGNRIVDSLYCKATLTEGTYGIWATTECSEVLGVYIVEKKELPRDVALLAPLTECEGFDLNMGVNSSQLNVTYELYKMVDGGISHRLASAEGNGERVTLASLNGAGTYYIMAIDTIGCDLQLSEMYSISPLPNKFNTIASDIEYCEGDAGVVFGIDGTDAHVNYWLQRYDETSKSYVNASSSAVIYGTGTATEHSFSDRFKAGKYRVVTESCHHSVMNDTIEIREIQQPMDIQVDVIGTACADSVLTVVLKNTEVDIRYVLLYNGVATKMDTLVGNGRDTSWTYTKALAGIYTIQLIREGCVYALSKEVEVGYPIENMVSLIGLDPICENETATLTLKDADMSATYELWGQNRDTLFEGIVSSKDVLFKGVIPSDNYFVIAKNGLCETRSEKYKFEGKVLPVIGDENFMIRDCDGSGRGDILLSKLDNNYKYTLIGPDCDVYLENWNTDSLLTNMSAGEYCLTVEQSLSACVLDPICKDIRRVLPEDSIVMPLNYCAGESGVILKLSGIEFNVIYSMLAYDHTEIETINYPSTVFMNTYTQGEYVFKKENIGLFGGCIAYDTIEVKELSMPSENIEVVAGTGGDLCEKGNNLFTLNGTEIGVDYILRLNGEIEVDTLAGNGGMLVFEGWKKAGTYDIIARKLGLCQLVIPGTWVVNPIPVAINAQGGHYCYDVEISEEERGIEIFVSNLIPSAKYYLTDNIKIDSISGMNAGAFKRTTAGEYVITGIFQNTLCWDTVARVKIEEIPLPITFTVSNTLGDDCSASARIALSGSEDETVEYYLYMDGYFQVGNAVVGTGFNIDFGAATAAGTYQVYAKKKGTECGVWMAGKVVVSSDHETTITEIRGSFCEGEAGGNGEIVLLNPKKDWIYFLSIAGVTSEEIKVIDQTSISWDSINNNQLVAGEYALNGRNECGDLKQLSKITILSMPVANKYELLTTDTIVCLGTLEELSLKKSDIGVSYQLQERTQTGDIIDLLPELAQGTGEALVLGDYAAGTYYVTATVDSSQCSILMDSLYLISVDMPPYPLVTNSDTCIVEGDSVVINLGDRRQPRVDYYLYVNNNLVDSILREDGEEIQAFKPRYELGYYHVISYNLGCKTKGAPIGVAKSPNVDIDILGGKDTLICSGNPGYINLDSSELGVKYVLLKDGFETSDTVRGTGNTLFIKEVFEAGEYRVKAVVSKEIALMLKDTLRIEILPSPVLEMDDNLGYCKGGSGVPIFIRNAKKEDKYTLTPPSLEWDQIVGQEGDIAFTKGMLYKAGAYKVVVKNSGSCMTTKFFDIVEIPLPEKYTLTLMEENKYICEYPEMRTLLLSSSQLNVQYSLYRRSKPGELALPPVDGTGESLTFQVLDTGRFYMVARSIMGEACETEMAEEIEILVPEAIKTFELVGNKRSYCGANQTELGSVRLLGSEPNVTYQLYQDGKLTTHAPFEGTGSVHEWSKLKGKPISLATGGDEDGYIYTVIAYNKLTSCSKEMKGRISIIEEEFPIVREHTPDFSACIGMKQNLQVVATGGMLHYRWELNGVRVGQEKYYLIDSITKDDIGVYKCYVSNQCGEGASYDIHVKVKDIVIMDHKMEDILICDEAPVAELLISSTAAAETYEWRKWGSEIVISKEPILVINDANKLDDEGQYICKASAGDCGSLLDTCLLEFNRNPNVEWTGDVSEVLCIGSKYSLEIESRDSVQWYKDRVLLDVTGHHFTIDSLIQSDGGSYSVKAKNACSTSEFIPIQTLFVDEPIRVDWVTDSVMHYCRLQEVTLKIVTVPSERVTYKWYRGGVYQTSDVGSEWTFSAAGEYNNVTHSVKFANTCTKDPEAKSARRDIQIYIDRPVVFTPLATEMFLCEEDGVSTDLKLKDKDVQGEKYEWYYKSSLATEYTKLKIDTAILSIEHKRINAGLYYSEITNACGTVLTNSAKVQIDSLPKLFDNLDDTTICENGNLFISLHGAGGHLSYVWKKQEKDSEEIHIINEITRPEFISNSSYTLEKATLLDDSTRIWCEISNKCGTIYSDTILLRITPNAKIAFEKSSVEMCAKDTIDVVVKLVEGQLPAIYSYKLNDGNDIVCDLITEYTDTLKIHEAGIYQLTSLEQYVGGCVEKTPSSVLDVSFRERYTATLTGDFKDCIGETAIFTITIDKGTGPWDIVIMRDSDKEIAGELGSDTIRLTENVSMIHFKPFKSEHYTIKSIVEVGGTACTGIGVGVASALVYEPALVSFGQISTDVFSGCEQVNFHELLKPTVAGGQYYVNNAPFYSTILPMEVGEYNISYVTKTLYGCQDSATVVLTREPLPEITLSLKDYLCPGESTELIANIKGTSVNGSREEFMVTVNMVEFDMDGVESFPNPLRKRTVNGVCSFNIYHNNTFKKRTYRVASVTDKYNCGLADGPVLSKTIEMKERPILQIETKHALYNGGNWTEDITDFLIPKEDGVQFRVTQLSGGNPWDMNMTHVLDGQEKVHNFFENRETVIENISGPEGLYRFSARDYYCEMAPELIEERTVRYTETGYLKVKLMLEGAYSKETKGMLSQIEELLPLEGLRELPSAGAGNHWIDWVELELRKTIDSDPIIRGTFLLRSDGYVADKKGNDLLEIYGEKFSLLEQNSYYVVIKHRNHLPISSQPVRIYTEKTSAITLDFTDINSIYSKDADLVRHVKELDRIGMRSVFGMPVGNVLFNNLISIGSASEIQLNGMKSNTRGYHLYDVSFDGTVIWNISDVLKSNDKNVGKVNDAYIVYKNRDMFSEVPEK